MNRIHLTTLLVFFSIALAAQDTINQSDAQGRKQGFWRKVDTAGQVVYEGRFTDGKPDGEFRYFYPGGRLKLVSKISGGGARAVTVSYYPSGRKMAEGNYRNEKRDSVWLFYGENTAALASREPYREGKIDGLAKIYFPDGTLSEQHFYRMGMKDGLWEQYYTDGKLKLRGAFKAGERHGNVRTYYESGRVMIEGQYDGGHQDGTWTYYDPEGAVTRQEFYERGRLLRTEPPEK